MTEAVRAPDIRFNGFSEAWEQRKLGECFDERSESMPNGVLISVTINEGIKKFSELGRHDNSNEDKSKYKRVCIGDIAYNSMRMWQGASGYSPYEGIVSPAYTVLSPKFGIDSKCMAYYFKHPDVIHTFQVNSQGITSDNWNLKYPALSEIEVMIAPKIEEQQEISSFLTRLDNIITLHQRKYDMLVNVKKSCLEKMFPKNGSNVPEVRFAGFTETWEQRKFSEVFSFLQNNTLSRADLSEESGAAMNVHYGDVLIKFGEYLDIRKERLAFIPTEAVANRYKSSFLQNGDVIIADTAEDETVGKCCEIANSEGNTLVSGLHTMPCRPNQKYASGFLGYYMNSPAYHDQLLPLMQGTKVTSVSKTAISDTLLLYPVSVDEQRRISQYLLSIDNLITLHQRKLDILRNIKKACLEKMFV